MAGSSATPADKGKALEQPLTEEEKEELAFGGFQDDGAGRTAAAGHAGDGGAHRVRRDRAQELTDLDDQIARNQARTDLLPLGSQLRNERQQQLNQMTQKRSALALELGASGQVGQAPQAGAPAGSASTLYTRGFSSGDLLKAAAEKQSALLKQASKESAKKAAQRITDTGQRLMVSAMATPQDYLQWLPTTPADLADWSSRVSRNVALAATGAALTGYADPSQWEHIESVVPKFLELAKAAPASEWKIPLLGLGQFHMHLMLADDFKAGGVPDRYVANHVDELLGWMDKLPSDDALVVACALAPLLTHKSQWPRARELQDKLQALVNKASKEGGAHAMLGLGWRESVTLDEKAARKAAENFSSSANLFRKIDGHTAMALYTQRLAAGAYLDVAQYCFDRDSDNDAKEAIHSAAAASHDESVNAQVLEATGQLHLRAGEHETAAQHFLVAQRLREAAPDQPFHPKNPKLAEHRQQAIAAIPEADRERLEKEAQAADVDDLLRPWREKPRTATASSAAGGSLKPSSASPASSS